MIAIEEAERVIMSQRAFVEKMATDPAVPDKVMNAAIQNQLNFEAGLAAVKSLLPGQIDNAKLNVKFCYNKISSYKNRWIDKEAIAVSFGPSLEKNIDELARLKDRYSIIAVDRAFPYLMERGIRPDYVSVIDIKMSAKYLEEYSTEGITLFAHAGSNHGYVKTWVERGGELSLFLNTCRLGSDQTLYEACGVDESIPISGNVGMGIIYLAAELLNCRKLLLVGFDNSWSDKYYPGGEVREVSQDDLESKKVIQVKDIAGNMVYVNLTLWQFNYYMTEYIMLKRTISGADHYIWPKIVNCTEGGILNIPNKDKLGNY